LTIDENRRLKILERERGARREERARRERGEKASVALEVHLWSRTIPEVATTKTTTAKKSRKGITITNATIIKGPQH
jgi:hypothetical protein